MKKKILIVAGVAFLLAGGAAAAFVVYHRFALPHHDGINPALAATEDALATPELLLFGSLDVDYLRKLEAKVYGQARLPDLVAPEPGSASIPAEIRRSLAKQYDSLSYFAFGLYQTKEAPAIMLVSGGELRAEQAIAFLRNHPLAKPAPNLPNAWTVQTQDVDTCALSKQWTIVVDKNRLIATDAVDIQIVERVLHNAAATRDLQRWREFRQERFAGAALFLPEEFQADSMDMMTRVAAGAAQKGLNEFEAVYLGAGAKPFPPRADFSLWLAAKSPDIATRKAGEWQAALAASRKDWQQALPTFAQLHDRAEITTRENLLLADMRVDEELVKQLGNIPTELLGLVFGGFNAKMGPEQGPGTPAAEVLERDPKQFLATVTQADIKPYDSSRPFAGGQDVVTGPFGIQLAAVRMKKGEPRMIELEIHAKGTSLPNVGDELDDAVTLMINSVKNAEGQELLLKETCGRERNDQAAKGQQIYGSQMLEVKKAVRLAEVARATDVARIEGVLRANLPTRVEMVTLKAPKVGDHVERNGLRIELTKVSESSVSYRASGKIRQFLHVRGKNAAGKILATGSRSGMHNASAKSSTVEFRGKVAELEFVLAQANGSFEYPFALTNAFPRVPDAIAKSQATVFGAYAPATLKRDLMQHVSVKRFSAPKGSATAGPAVVDLEQAYSFTSLNLRLSGYLPALKNLQGTFSAAEISIDEVTFNDGSAQRPPEGQPSWRAPLPLGTARDQAYVQGQVQIDTGLKGENREVRSLKGNLLIRVPLAVRSSVVHAAAIGTLQETVCGPVSVTEISRANLVMQGAGDSACAIAARVFDAHGGELTRDSALRVNESGWELTVGVSGEPQTIEIIAPVKTQKMSYPFTLAIPEPASTERTAGALRQQK